MNVFGSRGAIAIVAIVVWMSMPMSAFAADTKVELGGYCPVAYFKAGKAVKGKKELKVVHDGKTYYLFNPAVRDAFKKNPEKFLPVLDGLCVVCAKKGMNNPGKPEIFSVYNKKLYFFAGVGSKKTFDAAPEKYASFAKNYHPLALGGYCPVAYHKMGMAVKGKKEFSAVHDGKTYRFVKAGARDAFVKNPEMFLPAYNGLCIVCKRKGMDNPGKPEIFSIYKKKLYLFAGAGSKKTFDASPEKYAEAPAQKNHHH